MLQKCAFVLPSALSGVSSTSDQQFFRKSHLRPLWGGSLQFSAQIMLYILVYTGFAIAGILKNEVAPISKTPHQILFRVGYFV